MSRSLAVTKMHGACNDFVVIDLRTQPFASLRAFARWVCDRRTGIGADGVIAIEASDGGRIAMRTFNADGSEAEMCGNGVRCAARWLDEAGAGDELEFATDSGVVRTRVVARAPEYLVRAVVAVPRITAYEGPAGSGFAVDVGNPHAVFFRPNVDDFDLVTVAEALASDPVFPHGANVHVASVEGKQALRVRHWERGVGLTRACGSGAVACAAAAIAAGLVVSPVEINVPGGRLVVEWDGLGPAALTGPAERVFDTAVCDR
ncbi:MAG TPA: diaminopimelate epimerase [Candidatus Tumulicola sp.]